MVHKRISLFIILLVVMSLGASLAGFLLPVGIVGIKKVRAADINYTTDTYDIKMVVGKDHCVKAVEKVSVNFKEEAHGLYRYIPMDKDFAYRIEDVDVKDDPFDMYYDNGNVVLKIGDADTTITGKKSYEITYSLLYVEDVNDDFDNFNMNLWFTGWETPVKKVTTSLTLPKAIDWSKVKTFGGPRGSKEDQTEWKKYFTQKTDKTKNAITFTGKNVPADFGLTVQDTELPNCYWKGAPKYIESPFDKDTVVKAHDVKISATEECVVTYCERIDFDFKDAANSYSFNIPYEEDEYKIQNIRVPKGFEKEVTKGDSAYTVKVFEPEKKWTGEKSIEYSYDLAYYKPREDKDWSLMLCSNVANLSQHNVTMELTMPKEIVWSPAYYPLESYESDYPEASWVRFFKVDYPGTSPSVTLKASADWVPETYTLYVNHPDFPKEYWNYTLDYNKEHMGEFYLRCLPYVAVIPVVILLWILFGRTPKVDKPTLFTPPRGLAPAELAYVVKGKAEPEDMMSTLLYFADKGFLAIEEYEPELYKYVKREPIPASEWEYAKDLYHCLFQNGDEVRTDSLSQSFRVNVLKCCKTLKKEYRERFGGDPVRGSSRAAQTFVFIMAAALSLYSFVMPVFCIIPGLWLIGKGYERKQNSQKGAKGRMVGGMLLYALGAMLAGGIMALMTTGIFAPVPLVSFGILAIFYCIMPSRDLENAVLWGEVQGFVNTLKQRDDDRFREMQEQDDRYASYITAYAVALGLGAAWALRSGRLGFPRPYWYQGYRDDQDPWQYQDRDDRWLRHMMDSTTRDALPSPPASESGSFSDGGSDFSGGGGGGGGGGAW